MSAVDAALDAQVGRSMHTARLPRFAALIVLVAMLALTALGALLLRWDWGTKWVAVPIVAVVLTDIALPLWSAAVENRRAAVDRLVTALVWTALACALVPLVWVLAKTVIEGAPTINGAFLSQDGVGHFDPVQLVKVGGHGVFHALAGTLVVTAAATIISVPVGLMTAIYLVEYARGKWIGRAVTVLVDVMTGIPSIVAGLFALALFTVFFGNGTRLGIMGAVALSLLMIPTVVRASEEMMRLVPNDLREAAYALGVPKWRTIVKVVIPTSVGGLVTGVTLAVARVVGETAPLLVTVGALDSTNWNPFHDQMTTLPVLISNAQSTNSPEDLKTAWGAALLLIVIVMVLNLVARIVGKIFAPKTGR